MNWPFSTDSRWLADTDSRWTVDAQHRWGDILAAVTGTFTNATDGYEMTADDFYVLVDNSAGDATVTLPPADACGTGVSQMIVVAATTTNVCTIVLAGSDVFLNGAAETTAQNRRWDLFFSNGDDTWVSN